MYTVYIIQYYTSHNKSIKTKQRKSFWMIHAKDSQPWGKVQSFDFLGLQINDMDAL